jgi:molybdate transport system substrate-binding protein
MIYSTNDRLAVVGTAIYFSIMMCRQANEEGRQLMVRWLTYWGATLFILLISGCVAQPGPASTTTGATAPVVASAENSAASTELSGEVIVFAAASLTDAFGEIATNFQAAHPDTQIVYNFAGSQQLVQQLAQGAPADLFASANERQMEVAIESGRIISGTQQTFVHNRLVVIYPSDNPAGLVTLHDLVKPGLKLVLAAPEVPVGGYSLDFLSKASATIEYGSSYSETVLANVVSYEQNVRSVLSKVILGEADAGIVYTSDVTDDGADEVGRIEIPDELNTVANYPIALVSDSSNPVAAEAFIEYLLSSEGQAVLAAYGFVPAGQ